MQNFNKAPVASGVFYYMNSSGYGVPSKKRGARIFWGIDFPEEMSDGDIGKMTKLSKHLIHGNVIGEWRGGRRPWTIENIADVLGMERRGALAFMARMRNVGMVEKVGKTYVVNPAYFLRSNTRISKALMMMFEDTIHSIMPDWAVKELRERDE